MNQVQNIFNEWCNLRIQIGFKRKPKLTAKRKDIIITALCNYSEEDLIEVIRYIRFSHDDYAKFLRGDDGYKKNYTDCTNIFRKQKLKDKIEKAKKWSCETKTTAIDDIYIPFIIEDAP